MMGTNNKALMTHYAEGAIVTRGLEQMYNSVADAERFERDMPTETEIYREQKLTTPYGGD